MVVNLLPQELKPKGYALKISKALKKISVISIAFFLVAVVSVGASYFLLTNRTSASTKKQDELKKQIKALEQSEQKLVLIKDRIDKINAINASGNIQEEVQILEEVLRILPEGTFVREVELVPSDAKVMIVAGRSLDLTRFLANLVGQYQFQKIEMISFDYTPVKGYQMMLSLVR